MDEHTTFGAWVRRERKGRDLTQEALAERVGCSWEMIRKIEAGRVRPSRQLAELLLIGLDVPPAQRPAFVQWARTGKAPDSPPPPLIPGLPSARAPSLALAPTGPQPAALPDALPPGPRTNLPFFPTPLVGRESEIAAGRGLLGQPGVRLVTLTGPPGTGKTRLASGIAASLLADYAAGVWFVPLASIRDPGLVLSVIAGILGVREGPDQPLAVTLARYLRDKHLLLVLDNFEQVLDAGPLIAPLLAATAYLKVLVTSREALQLYGEHEFPVPPLDLRDVFPDGVYFVDLAGCVTAEQVGTAVAVALRMPESRGQPLVEQLRRYLASKHLLLLAKNLRPASAGVALLARLGAGAPGLALLELGPDGLEVYQAGPAWLASNPAVALFMARAHAAQPGFAATPAHLLAAAAIVARLDGLPLAIELAAARARLLAPAAILTRLDKRLSLLVGGPRDVAPRHQTLRSAIAWSYDLLLPQEQQVCRWLGVFQGGATATAIAAVGAAGGERGVNVEEILESLVSKSLLQAGAGRTGTPRFSMLETIHEFTREQLEDSGEAEPLRRAHGRHFLSLAQMAEPQLTGPAQPEWLARLEDEHDNIRAALHWAITSGTAEAVEVGLGIGGAIWLFWDLRSYLSEGRTWLRGLLAQAAGQSSSPGVRLKVLNGAAFLAWAQGDYAAARSFGEEAAAQGRAVGDPQSLGQALHTLGLVTWRQGDFPAARTFFAESLRLGREVRDLRGITGALICLGLLTLSQGDLPTARGFFEECLPLSRELGDKRRLAESLTCLGLLARRAEDYAAARTLLEESLSLRREIGDKSGIAWGLNSLRHVATAQGAYLTARTFQEESLALFREAGDKWAIATALAGLGVVLVHLAGSTHRRAALRGVRVLGAAQALLASIGAVLDPEESQPYAHAVAAARTRLGEEEFARADEEGRAMSMEQALAYALSYEQ